MCRDDGEPASTASSGSTCSAEGTEGSGGGGGAVFADQFENLANYRAHLATGAEIWAQVLLSNKYVQKACVPSRRVHCSLLFNLNNAI